MSLLTRFDRRVPAYSLFKMWPPVWPGSVCWYLPFSPVYRSFSFSLIVHLTPRLIVCAPSTSLRVSSPSTISTPLNSEPDTSEADITTAAASSNPSQPFNQNHNQHAPNPTAHLPPRPRNLSSFQQILPSPPPSLLTHPLLLPQPIPPSLIPPPHLPIRLPPLRNPLHPLISHLLPRPPGWLPQYRCLRHGHK
jgi:hypothetical protein